MLLDDVIVRVLRRAGNRLLVIQPSWPFPRWVDAADLQPIPFVPAPF